MASFASANCASILPNPRVVLSPPIAVFVFVFRTASGANNGPALSSRAAAADVPKMCLDKRPCLLR